MEQSPDSAGQAPTSLKSREAESRTRTPRDIIDQAIRENERSLWLLYGAAVLFALSGVSILIWAFVNREAAFAIAGSLTSTLTLAVSNAIRRTRRESLAIRLLELPLARAT